VAQGQAGAWNEYVHANLLPRVFGFELLMAPYTVAHLKLGLLLSELGYTFAKHERLGVYLTNTLEQGVTHAETLGLPGYLSEEGTQAAVIKNQKPIMVVLGNPPYSAASANKGEWISKLVRDYYTVDGAPLGERNPKNLQDDYVKFIRFAQWRIENTGLGIVGFITNHGYLDNPTFRGMRQSLLKTFDDIYVFDLHGNSKKREVAPDGGKDENIFDIQQGVAILLAQRKPAEFRGDGSGTARVHHADLWGDRDVKYKALSQNDVASIQWTDVQPSSPLYLFIPVKGSQKLEYENWVALPEIMPVHSSCMNTARDALVIDVHKEDLVKRMRLIARGDENSAQLLEKLGVHDTGWWKFEDARSKLEQMHDIQARVMKCLYRPFDPRWLFYDSSFIDRPRTEVNSQMLQDNLSMVTTRQTKEPFAVVATDLVCGQHKIAAVYDRSYFFPLYLYSTPESTAGTLFAQAQTKREPNLAPSFTQSFASRLKLTFIPDGKGDLKRTFGPEDIFNYMYAVFHSPTYRSRYAEFFKTNFPRLPLTSDRKLFRGLATKGAELVSLHLLRSPLLDDFGTTFPVTGTNLVEKVQYAEEKVWINDRQYFGGLPAAVWEFRVGAYQVCDKWLKDRKDRKLTSDDIRHYQRIMVAFKETIRLMNEIDAAIPGWPIG
jgi:predicted helicase